MKRLKEIYLLIRSGGLWHALKILRYTLIRDRLDRRYNWAAFSPDPGSPLFAQAPKKLLEAIPIPNGGQFRFRRRFSDAELIIEFLSGDIARVSWGPGAHPLPYALAKTEWPAVAIDFQETPGGWELRSEQLQITVQNDGGLRFQEAGGRLLRSELPPRQAETGWLHQANLFPEEHIYGLGEQAGRLDLRGGAYRMWNTDPGGSYGPGDDPLYMPVPLYLGLHSQGSYLVFYENYFPARLSFSPVEDNNTGLPPAPDGSLAEACFEGGRLTYYFIPGPPPRAIERYTDLTGRAPLPPLWSLGYHQSRWGYKSEEDIRRVAAGFQEHDLPLSAIHLDIDYMDGYRVFTVNQERFPNLAGLAREMNDKGIKLVAIIDPGVKKDGGYFLYQEGLKKEVFCTSPDGRPLAGLVWPGWSVFPDFTNPLTRQWWGEQYPPLLLAGISGFWHDMNEPTSFAAWGDVSLPLSTRHNLEGRGGDHCQAHNLYGLLMNRSGYEALRQQDPEHRPWIISRSGWAGQQRYAWNWTGDTESSWGGLRTTIPTILGMGLSGLPYAGPDIGGFSGDPSPELYLRSFQMAAFLPFFRTHSAIGTARREPWIYGEPYTAIIRQFLQLRYRLLPYFYTLAWECSQTGHPLVRPLFWSDPQDPNLQTVDDAFLLGADLLVAPVLGEGSGTRQVSLPAGSWLYFWDDSPFEGPGQTSLDICLENIPVFVRGGSVLPTQEEGSLILHVYDPGRRQGEGQLYSDAGDGPLETLADWRLDHFHLKREGGELLLDWDSEGEYPFPYSNVDVQFHGIIPAQAWLDGGEIACKGNRLRTDRFNQLRLKTKRKRKGRR